MERGILYLCIHKRICDKAGISGIIGRERFFKLLGETYHVPKNLRIIILKEMKKEDMIVELDRHTIKVNPINKDPEEQTNVLYKKWGIF